MAIVRVFFFMQHRTVVADDPHYAMGEGGRAEKTRTPPSNVHGEGMAFQGYSARGSMGATYVSPVAGSLGATKKGMISWG